MAIFTTFSLLLSVTTPAFGEGIKVRFINNRKMQVYLVFIWPIFWLSAPLEEILKNRTKVKL